MSESEAAVIAFNQLIAGRSTGMRILSFGSRIVYQFDGTVSFQITPDQEAMIRRLAKLAGGKATILDLSGVAVASSTALGYWAAIITQVKLNQGRAIMVHARSQVRNAVRAVGLDALCETADSLEDALARTAPEA